MAAEKPEIEGKGCKQCGFNSYRYVKDAGDGFSVWACRGCGWEMRLKDAPNKAKIVEDPKNVMCLACLGWPGCRLTYPGCNKFNSKCVFCGASTWCTKKDVPRDYSCYNTHSTYYTGDKVEDPKTIANRFKKQEPRAIEPKKAFKMQLY